MFNFVLKNVACMASDVLGILRVVLFVIIGLIILYIINRLLSRLAVYTKTAVDNRIMKATRRLDYLVILLVGIYLAIPLLDLPYYATEVSMGLGYTALFLITLIVARVFAILLDEALIKTGVPEKRRNITTNIVKIAIIALGSIGIITYYLQVIVPFAVSLGIIGFAFTFSLQYPLANFIGWMYISTSKTFKTGDRVKIGDYVGIVFAIEYLTTTIAELDSYGKPSGRILTMPNSTVLTTNILNWVSPPLFWDSISFTLAYESDLKRVQEIMLTTVKTLIEDEKLNLTVQEYEKSYNTVGFNHEKLSNEPYVTFDAVDGGWVRARLLYLVPVETSLKIKTLITERILSAFNREPETVKFPLGRSR